MFPVGTIIPYAGDLSKIPYGWHVCDGTNGTPDLSGHFLEGTTTTPKIFKDAGLPNITGTVGYWNDDMGCHYDGVFSLTRRGSKAHENGSSPGSQWDISFNASWSSPIYGASDTVQPKSYTVYYIMRVK